MATKRTLATKDSSKLLNFMANTVFIFSAFLWILHNWNVIDQSFFTITININNI